MILRLMSHIMTVLFWNFKMVGFHHGLISVLVTFGRSKEAQFVLGTVSDMHMRLQLARMRLPLV